MRESSKPGTTDYLIAFPTSADGPLTIPIGESYEHRISRRAFQAGETAFFIKTLSGSVNFDGKEDLV